MGWLSKLGKVSAERAAETRAQAFDDSYYPLAQEIYSGHLERLTKGTSIYKTPGRCLMDAHFTAMTGTMNRLAASDPALRNWTVPTSTYDAYLESLRAWAGLSPEQLAEGRAELQASIDADERRKAKGAELEAKMQAWDEAHPD